MDDLNGTLRELIQVQQGVLSRQQALDAGLRQDAIRARVRGGRWRQIQFGVYATFTGECSRGAPDVARGPGWAARGSGCGAGPRMCRAGFRMWRGAPDVPRGVPVVLWRSSRCVVECPGMCHEVPRGAPATLGSSVTERIRVLTMSSFRLIMRLPASSLLEGARLCRPP